MSLGVACEIWKFSDWETGTGVPLKQPVPFSHKHHVGELGIDCRYCHTTVEKSASAGIPPMHTCMSCHSQIWTNAAMLKPVRDSIEQGKPVIWNRVTRLPKYVYFDHSIHVSKGIGCVSCHGAVDEMPLMKKARTFLMRDCLSCHREPEKYIRPRDQVFNLHWSGSVDGESLVREYRIPKQRLTECGTCHR